MAKGIEPHSPTWFAVKEWADKMLTNHRAELETETCPKKRANFLRGRIAALIELLAMVEPKPEIPDGSTKYV